MPQPIQKPRFLSNLMRCIEIGVYTGYSSLAVALALPDGGKIVACDIDESFTNIAKRYWVKAGMENKIDWRLAKATQTLQDLIDLGHAGQYDFIFIDADKENYPNYYELSIQLLRSGGLIAIDNMFRRGEVVNSEPKSAAHVAIREL